MAKVSMASLLIFTDQFAAMIESQLPLVDVLENLAAETPQKSLQDILYDVVDDVRHGTDLGDALADYPDVFDPIYINVVRSGMNSGQLGGALVQLSDYLKNSDVTRKKVRSALTYPVFVVGAFMVAFNGMTFFILPRFSKMFSSMNKELPFITEMMLAAGDVWRDFWFVFAGGFGLVVVLFITWVASPEGRYLWDKNKMKMPVMGGLWRMAALAKFLRTFAVQVRNEVDVLSALDLAGPSSGNEFLKDVVARIHDDIEVGYGIAQAFRTHEVFSGIVLQMIASGEESSQIDRLLLSAADYYERVLENQIQRSTALINPILTVAVGIMIAVMMLAIFLPVFEMGKGIS